MQFIIIMHNDCQYFQIVVSCNIDSVSKVYYELLSWNIPIKQCETTINWDIIHHRIV